MGYTPKHTFALFDTRFFVTRPRQNPAVRFFVAYVAQPDPAGGRMRISARIFYKDLSLVWRCASHMVANDGDFWIGKGDVRTVVRNGYEISECVESTTDLPLEIQTALETLNRSAKRVREDEEALFLVLRNAPSSRVEPYRDFTEPRREAERNRENLVHGGKPVAFFAREGDPASLRVVRGFEPNFKAGIIEASHSRSAMYGGEIRRFRIASRNERIQYFFFAGPRHVWIVPPQTTTTELSSYGVRTVDVVADEDLFVPGYEYHFFDEDADESEHFSQIPEGYAGEVSKHDNDRADASAWLDQIPLIREFRRKVLKERV